MPNEEILIALKNALDHGDSLESAIQIMINSGYSAAEVQETANFVSAGSINLQAEPEEELVMPEQKKSFALKLKFWGKNKEKNKIPKPSESMKLSSESIKKQKIIPTQTKTLQQTTTQQQVPQNENQQIVPPLAQQQAIQQQAQAQQMPVQPQTQQVPQPMIQQTQKTSMQQMSAQQQMQQVQESQPTQQKPNILQQIARRAPKQAPRQAQPQQQLRPRQGELTKDLKKIKPKGTSHKKEIILVLILLALIGVLTATVIYRQTILGWFN